VLKSLNIPAHLRKSKAQRQAPAKAAETRKQKKVTKIAA
jgi:hypothetical protein